MCLVVKITFPVVSVVRGSGYTRENQTNVVPVLPSSMIYCGVRWQTSKQICVWQLQSVIRDMVGESIMEVERDLLDEQWTV